MLGKPKNNRETTSPTAPQNAPPNPEAMLRDLELQWQDHFHMRDQTWKTLTYVSVIFLGVVGLEIKEIDNSIMIAAYTVLIFSTIFGWIVASHHRIRQTQKFNIITVYETELGLYGLKKSIIKSTSNKKNFVRNVFTVRFIEAMHGSIGIIAIALLLKKLHEIVIG